MKSNGFLDCRHFIAVVDTAEVHRGSAPRRLQAVCSNKTPCPLIWRIFKRSDDVWASHRASGSDEENIAIPLSFSDSGCSFLTLCLRATILPIYPSTHNDLSVPELRIQNDYHVVEFS